jgi:WD40 repeat protein
MEFLTQPWRVFKIQQNDELYTVNVFNMGGMYLKTQKVHSWDEFQQLNSEFQIVGSPGFQSKTVNKTLIAQNWVQNLKFCDSLQRCQVRDMNFYNEYLVFVGTHRFFNQYAFWVYNLDTHKIQYSYRCNPRVIAIHKNKIYHATSKILWCWTIGPNGTRKQYTFQYKIVQIIVQDDTTLLIRTWYTRNQNRIGKVFRFNIETKLATEIPCFLPLLIKLYQATPNFISTVSGNRLRIWNTKTQTCILNQMKVRKVFLHPSGYCVILNRNQIIQVYNCNTMQIVYSTLLPWNTDTTPPGNLIQGTDYVIIGYTVYQLCTQTGTLEEVKTDFQKFMECPFGNVYFYRGHPERKMIGIREPNQILLLK